MIYNITKFYAYMNFYKQSKRNSKRRKFDTFSCKRNLRNDWEITQRSISHSLNLGTRKYLREWKDRSTRQISIVIKRNRSRQIFIFQTSKRTNHWTQSSKMIKSLKKQLEKRQALWEIRDKIRWLENSIFIEEIHETRHFNNYATQALTRLFQIIFDSTIKLRHEKVQWKLQFNSEFWAFIVTLSSFDKRLIKFDQKHETARHYSQNAIRNEKESWKFQNILS
jgi:hypothetical protein